MSLESNLPSAAASREDDVRGSAGGGRFTFSTAATLVTITAALLCLRAGAAAAGQNDTPIAAPGQSVPAHAAGGWPTDTTGDTKKPGRTPEQQAQVDALTGELKRLANEFGPDSVVLQSKLLIRSMAAGAVGPTEVRVAGPSATPGPVGPGHLEIDIDTGIFFDENTTNADSRRETIWKNVAAPVLDEMVSFKIEPTSLELVFLYDVQALVGAEGFRPVDDSRREAFRVRLSRAILDEMAADRVIGDAVREKAEFTPAATVPQPRETGRP